ncbi:MAG: class D beta-lactamase [Bacteroidetes bacterium HGW-Bacteroidetes-21]|jgi:beta-lactamase class D|nr:MAG: class D beta-lactamase [Bacteroidetes bacterium HGW-Bacteroidetes-21]
MNKLFYLISVLFLFSCSENQETKKEVVTQPDSTRVVSNDLQIILDSADVTGSILIYDPQSKTWYSNNFDRCSQGFLPASTFKIPNSLIALETGIVENDSTLFTWDGKKRRLPVWEQNLYFSEAFYVSCVPCYQDVARKIGVERMKKYLTDFDYGHMIFDSTTIDLFWLEGESKITQFEQISFLQRFFNKQLPISNKTYDIMKRMMIIDKSGAYVFSGKTGWAIRNENNIGWFVGYIEKDRKVYFVAVNIEPNEAFNMDMFPKIRTDITIQSFLKLGFI